MHELIWRLYRAEAAGLTGHGLTYTEWLLEQLLAVNLDKDRLAAQLGHAEAARRAREAELRESK